MRLTRPILHTTEIQPMSTINGKSFSSPKNINLKDGILRFAVKNSTNPLDSSSYGLYVNSSGALVFNGAGSTTIIGAAGGAGSTPTWETLFGADTTFTITPDSAFTIAGNRSTATDVVVLTNIGGGSGNVIQITNSGTGKDINGTSNTWNVTKAGVATFAGVSISGTTTAMAFTGAATFAILDNSATSLSIGSTGATSMLVFDTSDGAEVLKTSATIFQVTQGKTNLIQASNTVSGLVVTDNTVTTFGGNANSAGVVVIRSTSLTTGSLLQLQVTEGTLAGGFFIVGRHVTAGANVYTVGENGVTTIAGLGGSDMLTITAGDIVAADGSITLTDADNAATLSVTNNTATSASAIVIAGSGTFTGSTTTSFMTLTASGLTTGTVLYIPAAALTTGKVINIAATAATDGVLVTVTGGGANMTATGSLATLAMGAATVGNAIAVSTSGVYTGTGIVTVTANGLTTGHALVLSSSGVMTTTGDLLAVTANSATTSTGIVRITANGLTTGTALLVTSSGTVTSSSTGVATITASGLTTGYGLQVTDGGASNTLTSGFIARFLSNSNDTTARAIVNIVNDNTAATGTHAILIQQDAVTSTNYRKLFKESNTGITLWMGNGTGGNGVLSGTAGDILFNGASNKPEYCTGTTVWVALV